MLGFATLGFGFLRRDTLGFKAVAFGLFRGNAIGFKAVGLGFLCREAFGFETLVFSLFECEMLGFATFGFGFLRRDALGFKALLLLGLVRVRIDGGVELDAFVGEVRSGAFAGKVWLDVEVVVASIRQFGCRRGDFLRQPLRVPVCRGSFGVGLRRRFRIGGNIVVDRLHRSEDGVRQRRLRQRVAQRDDAHGQIRVIRQHRGFDVELPHHVFDHIGDFVECIEAREWHRHVMCTQSLQIIFQRSQYAHQHGDVDHGHRATQCVHGTQQRLADSGGRTRTLGGAELAHHADMLRHLAAQDFQQYRIHRRQYRRCQHGFVDGFLRRCGGQCGVGEACRRHVSAVGLRTRHAAHDLALDGARGRGSDVLDARGFARREFVRGLHDGGDRRAAGALAAQAGQQYRQRRHGMLDQRDHLVAGCDGLVEHAVQHVLDLPAELAHAERADQTAGTLERVEGAPNRLQQFEVAAVALPVGHGRVERGDFILELFHEDFADVFVDFIGDGLEAGTGVTILDRNLLLDFFLDLDPVVIRRRGGRGFGQGKSVDIVFASGGRRRFTHHQIFETIPLGHADRLGKVGHGGGRRRCHRRVFDGNLGFAPRWHRPIADGGETLLRHVQNPLTAGALFARRLEVVLDGSQRVGELVHLLRGRHAPIHGEFVVHEAPDAAQQVGRPLHVEHAHGARDFFQQLRDLLDLRVVPWRFDERSDVLLDLGQVDGRLVHQRIEHAARFGAERHVFAIVRVAFGTEVLDVIVERGLDVKQCASDIEQDALVVRLAAIDDALHRQALLIDDTARHGKTEHAEGVADTIEDLDLRREVRDVGCGLAQEQVERVLHAQQVVLDCHRDGVEQRAVVARHGATRVFHFGFVGQRLVELVGTTQRIQSRTAALGVGNVVQQLACEILGITTSQRHFAAIHQLLHGAVDATDQRLDVLELVVELAYADTFQHAAGDPPQAPTGDAVASGAQFVEDRAHRVQAGAICTVAHPAEQRDLEALAQAAHGVALGIDRQRLRRARGISGKFGAEVGREQYRFAHFAFATRGAQVVQQWQQHHRDVAVAALHTLEIIGDLHHAAHQHAIGIVAIAHGTGLQRLGELLHLLDQHRRAVQLDHAQGAVDLVQVIGAPTDATLVGRVVDVGFQRLARLAQGLVELVLDPTQRGELDVVVNFHAPLPRAASVTAHGRWPLMAKPAGCAITLRRNAPLAPGEVNRPAV